MEEAKAREIPRCIHLTTIHQEAFKVVGFVIEAVFEDVHTKRQVFH